MSEELKVQDGTDTVIEQPPAQAAPQESEADRNWKVMRQQKEETERRLAQLEQHFKEQQERATPETAPTDDYDSEYDDMYVNRKQLSQREQKMRQEIDAQRKEMEAIKQQTQMQMAEQRLKAQYKDFDAVVTEENLEKLKQIKPAAFRSIASTPDLSDKGEMAYDLLRQYGIVKDKDDEDLKVEQNQQKPRAANTVAPHMGESPLSQVGNYDRRTLSETRKAELRRQVAESRKYR